MYQTKITFYVLSETPINPHLDLDGIVYECNEGEYVMGDVNHEQETLSGKQMADALIAAGSTPDFFELDEDGNHIE